MTAARFNSWLLAVAIALAFAPVQDALRSGDNADREKAPPVLKADAPVVVLGTVVAISQETVIESLDSSADLMLLRIVQVLSGKETSHYIRGDFSHRSSVRIEPDKAATQRQLLNSLRMGKTMKIHLRRPREGDECRWTIPAPPKPGEEIGLAKPVIVPVAGAKGYPYINGLRCYAFELQDIEEGKVQAPMKVNASSGSSLTEQLKEAISKVRMGSSVDSRTHAAEHLASLTQKLDREDVREQTIQDLISLLDSPDDSVRFWVAGALGNLGPSAKAAIPKLEKLLPEADCINGVITSAGAIRHALTQLGATPPPPPKCDRIAG